MLQEPATADLEHQCSHALDTAVRLNRATARWHLETPSAQDLVDALHLANFELWHLEDQARDTTSGDAAVAATKRSIDQVNQRRNDTVETIDAALLRSLAARSLPLVSAPLHSETPGQMLDRLSILALKLYHTELEANRTDASSTHREQNKCRLDALREQQHDLAACLSDLWAYIESGKRRFKLYRQLKMYNDPALNPVLYAPTGSR